MARFKIFKFIDVLKRVSKFVNYFKKNSIFNFSTFGEKQNVLSPTLFSASNETRELKFLLKYVCQNSLKELDGEENLKSPFWCIHCLCVIMNEVC